MLIKRALKVKMGYPSNRKGALPVALGLHNRQTNPERAQRVAIFKMMDALTRTSGFASDGDKKRWANLIEKRESLIEAGPESFGTPSGRPNKRHPGYVEFRWRPTPQSKKDRTRWRQEIARLAAEAKGCFAFPLLERCAELVANAFHDADIGIGKLIAATVLKTYERCQKTPR